MALSPRQKKILELNYADKTLANVISAGNDAATPSDVVYTIGTEATDVINVVCQFNDADGNAMTAQSNCVQYLSDAVTGEGMGTAHSTAPVVGTDGAVSFILASLCWVATSESDGDLDIDFEDSGTQTVYLVTILPNGKKVVSAAITHAA